jgi:hypothetical protein
MDWGLNQGREVTTVIKGFWQGFTEPAQYVTLQSVQHVLCHLSWLCPKVQEVVCYATFGSPYY